jgi:segregation and condensation protein A
MNEGILEEGNFIKSVESGENVSQNQIHDLIFNREIEWREIIFDLINTKQLDPWDVDIGVLSDSFFERIEELQEMDFFVSSKVLLAASLLLRLKSELLLSFHVRTIDDVLFGRENEVNSVRSSFERIELDEEIPELIPKTPMPRYKRVTLNQLIDSLNRAIVTENRRIKKTIVNQNALRETGITLPKRDFNIQSKLKDLRNRLNAHFDLNSSDKRVAYTNFIGEEREDRALSFFPLLQLENNGEIWLEQEELFDEIHIWFKHIFLKHNPDPFEDLKINLGELTSEELRRLEEVEEGEVL